MKPGVEPKTAMGVFAVLSRRKWMIVGVVSILVLAAILIRAVLPAQSLNDDELRLVGSWTRAAKPGEYIYNFHSDGTLRFGAGASSGSPSLQHWWIRNKKLTVEYSGDDEIPLVIQRHVLRVMQEAYPLDFNQDGGVDWGTGAMIRWDGPIPWSGADSEESQKVE